MIASAYWSSVTLHSHTQIRFEMMSSLQTFQCPDFTETHNSLVSPYETKVKHFSLSRSQHCVQEVYTTVLWWLLLYLKIRPLFIVCRCRINYLIMALTAGTFCKVKLFIVSCSGQIIKVCRSVEQSTSTTSRLAATCWKWSCSVLCNKVFQCSNSRTNLKLTHSAG